jgi:hypothetical protein
MKYMLLIYETPEYFRIRSKAPEDEESWGPWRAYYKALLDAGVYLDGAPLEEFTTGTTVRLRNGQRQVQDGPYADTKEQLGGFILLELPSLDAALDWAARCPVAASGAIEVRPVADYIFDALEHQNG